MPPWECAALGMCRVGENAVGEYAALGKRRLGKMPPWEYAVVEIAVVESAGGKVPGAKCPSTIYIYVYLSEEGNVKLFICSNI